MEIIDLIQQNKEFIAILISFLTLIVPFTSFLITKNREQKQLNFEKFHRDLMKGLSNLDKKNIIGLEQQIAIIYEFRNYPKYYPVIRRILFFEIKRWKKDLKEKPHFAEIINEANETISFTKKNYIKRLWTNFNTR